jgi:hypothetical protein
MPSKKTGHRLRDNGNLRGGTRGVKPVRERVDGAIGSVVFLNVELERIDGRGHGLYRAERGVITF